MGNFSAPIIQDMMQLIIRAQSLIVHELRYRTMNALDAFEPCRLCIEQTFFFPQHRLLQGFFFFGEQYHF